jgi:hypothetical protein
MIRVLDAFYAVDGTPMLTPDMEMAEMETDIDEEDSGRDESQFMHRFVAREKVRTWAFSYAIVDGEDLAYTKALFAGRPTFLFSYEENGKKKTVEAYCSKLNYKKCRGPCAHGLYKELKFNIIQC